MDDKILSIFAVAPLAGAWIEILSSLSRSAHCHVAPFDILNPWNIEVKAKVINRTDREILKNLRRNRIFAIMRRFIGI